MPSVPRYGQPRVQRTPLPGATFQTPRETYTSAGGAMGEALAGAGDAATRFGMQALQRERERKAQIFQLEVGQQLQQLDSIYWTSPDKGLRNKQGKEPMDLRDKYLDEIDIQLGEISKNAHTPEEQAFVREASQRWRAQFVANANTHASSELTKYEFSAMNASLEAAVNRGAMYAGGGAAGREVIAESSDEIERILRTHGPRFGMDPQSITNAIDNGRARLHDAVIDRLIDERKTDEAAKYWDQVKDSITSAEARAKIGRKVEQNTIEQKAFRVVDQVLAELGPDPADDDAPFQTDKIERRLRELLQADPDAYKVAREEFRSRKAGIEDAREQRRDALQLPLLEAILKGATAAQIMRMPQWKNAGEKVQLRIAQLADQAEARREARQDRIEDRNYSRAMREQNLREINEFADYAKLADPATLSRMSYREVLEASLTLPPQLGERLINLHRSLTNVTSNAPAVTLDEADIKRALEVAGYRFAVQKPRGDWTRNELAMFGRLDAEARQEVDRLQRGNGNKPLSVEDKGKVLKGLLDRQVSVSGLFNLTTSRVPAISVGLEQAGRVYVPLAEIPKTDLDEYVRWFRENTPEGRRFAGDDAALIRRYQPRFEKAYGLRLIGAPPEVIQGVVRDFTLPESR